jgi:uncharacterized protein YdhG (YjbR/CyaY superfamily)
MPITNSNKNQNQTEGELTMDAVDDYINSFEGEKREWLATMISFMRQTFPQAKETISYQMPMFKFDGNYIAFSIAKDHFTFHTLDFEMIEELKLRLPKSKFGRGSAKIGFSDRAAIPVLFEMCRKIVARSSAGKTIKLKEE